MFSVECCVWTGCGACKNNVLEELALEQETALGLLHGLLGLLLLTLALGGSGGSGLGGGASSIAQDSPPQALLGQPGVVHSQQRGVRFKRTNMHKNCATYLASAVLPLSEAMRDSAAKAYTRSFLLFS